MSSPREQAIMCDACGHKHRGRCRHRLNPHFYEHPIDAPRCECEEAVRLPRRCVCAYPCECSVMDPTLEVQS